MRWLLSIRLWRSVAAFAALPFCLCDEEQSDGEQIAANFARLWQLVIVDQQSRGVVMADVPMPRLVCQYGLGELTYEVARFLLGRAAPGGLALELHDMLGTEAKFLASQLQEEFGDRVQLAGKGTGEACDVALYSKESPLFTIERLLQQVEGSRYIAVSWISFGCVTAEGNSSSHECGFLNNFWENSLLLRRGYCIGHVCLSRVPVGELHDPNVLPLECENLLGERGELAAQRWKSPAAEFSQDWYVIWNFLKSTSSSAATDTTGEGYYVDVGACLPFEYSNTIVFERCLNWKGICIEANPGLMPWVRAYRSCTAFNNCVMESSWPERQFYGRDGGLAFASDCRSLQDILTEQGLKGKRIDVLSIDVEHGELGVLNGLRLDDFDIQIMIIEVGRGARWLEIETVVLQHGYAKVAVLGRDVVYAKLSTLVGRISSLAEGLPSRWRRHHGAFLLGHAAGDEFEGSLQDSQARCEWLGDDCGGVTCSSDESSCSVRAGTALYGSPSGEVSYAKVSATVPAGQAGTPAIALRDKALLPPDWADFHQRVLDEELGQEMRLEKELAMQGKRRFA
eukprot:TRINITY_DN113365_c0_g1_i1.p1 TRINITY_DN113365_c0_g1~~TRINITY_DN113365_c0_g1_i1.p1  ORF type:complete len:568 (+),score=100.77 TRINITY_DN113365_c0_g1_i1:100-1803(+)